MSYVQASDAVFTDSFESHPSGQWGYSGDQQWATAESVSGDRSIYLGYGGGQYPGYFRSHPIAATPFEHYEVTLASKTQTTSSIEPTYLDVASDGVPWGGYTTGDDWQDDSVIWRNPWNATDFRISLRGTVTGVYVDDVVVKKLTRLESAALQDAAYAKMSDFRDRPTVSHANLDRTFQTLESQGHLKVVMLGDSIVNDSSRTGWEAFVDRQYPGSRTDVVPSVASGKGMWWYKEENRLQSYVFDHHPDLVMLGGISHQNDIESVREVINQIHAFDPDIEILLMSEMAGKNNPYVYPELLDPFDPTSTTDWRALMYQLSQEEGVGYLDAAGAWARYVQGTHLPYGGVLRDSLHMNTVGSILAGRAFNDFFAPLPEPSAVALVSLGAAATLRRRRRGV